MESSIQTRHLLHPHDGRHTSPSSHPDSRRRPSMCSAVHRPRCAWHWVQQVRVLAQWTRSPPSAYPSAPAALRCPRGATQPVVS